MNKNILNPEVQEYIGKNLKADADKIALSKSPFLYVSSGELSNQITAKNKSEKKLPSWFNSKNIYYPPVLSIEQTSSERTAAYKTRLVKGLNLIDLTGGFGVDDVYFAKKTTHITHCEINSELSDISKHNAAVMGINNIRFIAVDGIEYLKKSKEDFGTIYIDPARRGDQGKVFMLKDCSPDVTKHIDLFLSKADRVIIKTAPLLDISAGLRELHSVSEIHIISIKNECKELLWVIDKDYNLSPKIVCCTLNEIEKQFSFYKNEAGVQAEYIQNIIPGQYLYEPDVALLKSGAFDLIGRHYKLAKLHSQTQLYLSNQIQSDFPGRIFKVEQILNLNTIKKDKHLVGSVVVRNFPGNTKDLVKKYKIKQDDVQFLIFTKDLKDQYIVIKASILQHY